MNNRNPLVSIIIPIYNEEKYISRCLNSIKNQTFTDYEIIIINDGSTDKCVEIVRKHTDIILLMQEHNGPGVAKNYGAKFAKGKILVFIDGDMYLDKDYLKSIISPILHKKSIATYTTSEFVSNINNIWSKCWNINQGLPYTKSASRINLNDKTLGLAFRAILRNKYISYGGFNPSWGYIDDRSIDKIKNNILSVNDAICYHYNPDNLLDVYLSARWIGRSSMFRLNMNNILKYSIINSFRISVNKIISGAPVYFLLFKIVFDLGVLSGIINNNYRNNRSK